MRKLLFPMTAFALVLVARGAAHGDAKADARAIIDKAIEARGGAAKLGEMKATTFKIKGKYYGMGAGIDYTGEYAIQPPDRFRVQMEIDANGTKFVFIEILDGDKGYRKVGDMATTELDKEQLAEAIENAYAGRVEALVPLIKDKGFELSPLGEVKVEDRAAVGVRVSHKGHRDINLFFDKTTGLLVKSERTVKDLMMGGKEFAQEELPSDYKDVGGVKHPMKIVIKRDGKDFVDGELSDFEVQDKLDASVFAKP
jgi:hypothetical protein